MIEFLKKLENFNEPNTADSEAEHKYLWYTWMYHKLQLPRLFEVKKN